MSLLAPRATVPGPGPCPEPRDSPAAQPTWAERPLARRLLPDTAEVGAHGRLQVGGIDVLDLVAEYGTPLFVYDEEHLRRRCREARRAFGPGVAYAAKAFLCTAMARLAAEESMALDVSTGGELQVALRAGVHPSQLVLHGSNKSAEELATAVRGDVGRVVIDSFDEIERLEAILADVPRIRPPRVLLRVNPGVAPDTHAFVATGQLDSKFGFGIPTGAAAAAVRRVRRLRGRVELVGIHAHVGSQLLDLSSLRAAVAVVAELFVPLGLEELCLGGGLGVRYTAEGGPAPGITAWAAALHEACADAGVGAHVRVTAEPGRAIAAVAGLTCYTVGTIKVLPGLRTYVSVDGGMSDNLRPALYGSRYEAFLPRATTAPRPRAATVVGKHCECGDVVVADGRLPADVAVGDVLATPVTGAYGYAMASNYNKVPRPAVVFVRDGTARVVLRRETIDDLLRLDTCLPAPSARPAATAPHLLRRAPSDLPWRWRRTHPSTED